MFNNVNRKIIIYYLPTFRAKLKVKETRVKSGFHEGLGAKNHWNFRCMAERQAKRMAGTLPESFTGIGCGRSAPTVPPAW
jgi:hypothetical protein